MLITFSVFLFTLLNPGTGVARVLAVAVPYLILAGFAVMIHHDDHPNPGPAISPEP